MISKASMTANMAPTKRAAFGSPDAMETRTGPGQTQLFMCHDHPPIDRPIAFESTVAEQRAHTTQVHDGITEAEFVTLRTPRDATLEMPVLMLPAVQINIWAGRLPSKEENGIAYAKIPLNTL